MAGKQTILHNHPAPLEEIRFYDNCPRCRLEKAAPALLQACKEGLAECERSKLVPGSDIVGLAERIELIEAAINLAEPE